MKGADLEKSLARTPPAGVYVLAATQAAGFDIHLADACLRALIEHTLPAEEREAALSSFDGEDCALGDLLGAFRTLPMFSPRNVIVCRRADKLPTDAHDALMESLSAAPESNVIVLIAEKLDGRLKVTKFLKERATWVDVSTPTEPEALADWAIRRFAELGKRIDKGLARELAVRAGRLTALGQQVEQIALYLGDRQDVTRDAAAALWRAEPEDNVFAITDALARRDGAGALRALAEADRASAHHLQLLALIEGALRRLVGIRQGLDEGLSNDAIAAQLGIKPGAVYHQRENARRWDAATLRDLHRRLLAVEYETKTGGGEPRLRLERFLVEACG